MKELRMWMFAIMTVIFAAGSLWIIIWQPTTLLLALTVGLIAIVSHAIYIKVRADAKERVGPSSVVANAGLVLAALAIAPLVAFALLWFALMVVLAFTWLLSQMGA
jgi:hypothetical protein